MKVMRGTNTCIEVMRGNRGAMGRLSELLPGDCVVLSVVVFELFVGVEKCVRPESERLKVQRLLAPLHVVPFNHAAAVRAGQLRAELERTGNLCGPYDVLIAAHALALGLAVVTHDTAEFSRVSGLVVVDWIE